MLSIVPVVLLVLSVSMVREQGPWSLHNADPEFCYLFNSLNLLTAHYPDHTDHPGTTLQEFGAVIEFGKWIMDKAQGEGASLVRTVLSRPNDYLRAINLGIVVFAALAIFAAGFRMFLLCGSLFAALILQASVLMFHQTVLALPRVSPEPFLIGVGFALMLPLIPELLGKERNPNRASLVTGAIFGFGMVTKVTFLPMAATAALLKGEKHFRRFALSAGAAIVFFALPIYTKVPRVLAWLTSLVTHTGIYGKGPAGIPSGEQWLSNLGRLLSDEPLIFVVLAFYLAALAALRFAARDPLTDSVRRLLYVASAALTVQLAMTLKHYNARYMLPSLVFCALANGFLALLLSSRSLPIGVRQAFSIAGAAVLILGAVGLRSTAEKWRENSASQQAAAEKMSELRAQQGDCLVVSYYGGSTPDFALALGNDYSAGDHSKVLIELYSDRIIYDLFGGGFWSYSHHSRTRQVHDLVDSGRCVLMEGRTLPAGSKLDSEFLMEPIATAGDETLYRLSTAPPAMARILPGGFSAR